MNYYDVTGKQIKLGDKIKGEGYIKFQDGFKIDRTPIVTVNKRNGRIYCGELSIESFPKLWIII